MEKCRLCSSYAINPGHDGREEYGKDVDLDLCNVCYWRTRAEAALAERAHYGDIMTEKLGAAEARVEELESRAIEYHAELAAERHKAITAAIARDEAEAGVLQEIATAVEVDAEVVACATSEDSPGLAPEPPPPKET